MKECEYVTGLFGQLHDEQVDSDTKEVVHEHFRNCTECREDFKWYGITVQALASLEEVAPPEDFVAQLNARLYGPTPSVSHSSYLDFFRNLFSSSPYLPLPVGVASLAFIMVVGFAVYNNAPSDLVSPEAMVQMHQGAKEKSAAGAVVAVGDSDGTRSSRLHMARPLPSPLEPSFPATTSRITDQPIPVPKSLGSDVGLPGRRVWTVADRIGGDNLTVESPSIDQAVESVKRILPNIHGRLVEEQNRGTLGEKVLGVLIPSRSYGHLTTELINHGAVAAGVAPDAKAPAPTRTANNNVILYIRFVKPR